MDGPRKDTFDVLKELAGLANGVAAEIKYTPDMELDPEILRYQRLQIVRSFGRATEALEGLAVWRERSPVQPVSLDDAAEAEGQTDPSEGPGGVDLGVGAEDDTLTTREGHDFSVVPAGSGEEEPDPSLFREVGESDELPVSDAIDPESDLTVTIEHNGHVAELNSAEGLSVANEAVLDAAGALRKPRARSVSRGRV